MTPTLSHNQLIVFWCWATKPKLNSLVMADINGREVVKRVTESSDSKYYLVGDNPAASTDSRQFGWVDSAKIIGRRIF